MATNSAVNLNQLKKSVFNMKNYVDSNIKTGYTVEYAGDFEIKIDSEGNVSNNNNPTSQCKKSNGQNYLTWEAENIPITSETLVRSSISIDGNTYSTDMSIIGESTAKGYSGILKMSSGNNLSFQLTFRFNTKYAYLEDGTVNKEPKQDTQSMILMFYSKDENLINKIINVKYTIYSYNKNSLNNFPSLKSTSLYSITQVDNESKTGIGSINLSSGPSPHYTFIMSGMNGHNEFKNNCYYGQIIGYRNILDKFQFYNILGRYNNINGKPNTSYYENYINILGEYNNYTADASAVNYKPVSILGNYINACNSGLYIGMSGTFEKDDIMGIADGTQKKEKIIFRVKRDGRVKASVPTENDDLTNKKYVDDKVAGIVNSAPETLDTLQELATALGNDPNFATTVATQIGKKVDKVDGMSLTHNDLTNELKANYNAAYAYSQAKHSYNDLTDKPVIPSIEGLATTEYVDDKAVSKYTQLKDIPIEIFPYTEKLNSITNTTQKICAVNAADLKANTTYMCPDNCGRLGIKHTKLDNTEIAFFLSYNTNNLIIQTGYKDDKKIEILIDGIVYTVTFKTATEEPKVEKTVRYLTDKNTVEFTPTKEYQPSTKKYVDDTVVFKKLSSIVELNSDNKKIINVEKFEDNKIYYFINDLNKGATSLFTIYLYKNGENNNTIVVYPNDRFITMSYKSSTNEFFKFSDMDSIKYNLVNKTEEYDTIRSVTKKVSAEQVLTKTNTIAFTPTADYHPTTKKYVDDKVVGLATESYVDSKTSMENVIYEGNGTGPDVISDYWTGCPVSSGNGCWVINKQITFDSSKPNPYYLLCDNTLYSPENSTFDATNSAWIYPKVYNTGTIFICNKYNGENKLVLPWDNANSPSKMKLYTKTELATAISDGDLEATSDEVKAMLANVLGGDYSGKKN